MKLHRGLLALTAVILTVPAGVAVSRAPAAAPSVEAQAPEKADSKQETPKDKPAAYPAAKIEGKTPDEYLAAKIEGKTLDEWWAALKDRDPAVRERAVETLGELALAPGLSPEEQEMQLTAVAALASWDRDQRVRQAAIFFWDLGKLIGSPERVKQALEQRRKAVKPTRTSIRLVDDQGRPVPGAVAGTYFQRDADKEPSFDVPDGIPSATSDARGELALTLEIPGHLDAASIYAIRRDGEIHHVGLQTASREEIRQGKPVTIVMHPACRVSLRVECLGLGEIAEKYHAELGGENGWRAAYLGLGENHQAPGSLFTYSTDGQLEFLLPPGRFLVTASGSDTNDVDRTIEVTPGNRLLDLGVIELAPSEAIKQGVFKGYWRTIRRHAGAADEESITFRRPRYGIGPKGEAQGVQDAAYSPDGTLLATAHWYSVDPGEVKLWDAKTGKLVASLPVATPGSGVLRLKFSPDGKTLAGSVGHLEKRSPTGVVVLWDVAGRRELRSLVGHSGRIAALAFSPDSKALASGGEDRTVRIWDVVSGKETRRLDGKPGVVRALAYSPDGKALAIGNRETIRLWDVPGDRFGATLEPGGFWVQSVAFAPDGRTLAASGSTVPVGIQQGVGQVRLYDLAQEPPVRRAELTNHHEGQDPPTEWMNDVEFTPDGRRVIGIARQSIVIWDVATGAERDSLDRGSNTYDQLAISPDGRWLAVATPGSGVGIYDIGTSGR